MKRPSRSKKRYKNDDDRPYFKRREQVEVTQDFIENIGDPDFPRYGWIVKKSRPLMSDPGYEYLIERDPEFAADDGYDKSYWVYDNEIQRGRYNEGTYWPTPENERIPIYTLELSREDDDGSHDETPMKYSVFYYSDDTAFAAAENLADEFANEDGKFYVHVIAGEYMIDGSTDIYGDPYVQDSIQTGRGWKMVKEGFMSNIGKDGQRLYSIMYSADGWDGSVQEYGKSEEDAIQAAIAKGKLDDEDEIVKVVDLGEKGEYLESSRKLVKEGAGAGYTVTIKDLKLGKIIDAELIKGKKRYDDYYKVKVAIQPCECEIGAEDYYNDFFWKWREFGETPTAKIDGGVATVIYSGNGTDDDEEQMRAELDTTIDISFDYGWGWTHADLPETITSDHVNINSQYAYFEIQEIELNAPDLAVAVNDGWKSVWEDDDEENENGEPVNESSDEGWHEVTDAFEEFEQRLWSFTKQDMKGRRDAFSRCTNSMEKAMREYYNDVVYDGAD